MFYQLSRVSCAKKRGQSRGFVSDTGLGSGGEEEGMRGHQGQGKTPKKYWRDRQRRGDVDGSGEEGRE